MWYTRCNTSFFYQKLSPLCPLSVTFIHVLHRFGLRPEKDARPPGSAGISFHVYFFSMQRAAAWQDPFWAGLKLARARVASLSYTRLSFSDSPPAVNDPMIGSVGCLRHGNRSLLPLKSALFRVRPPFSFLLFLHLSKGHILSLHLFHFFFITEFFNIIT